MTKSQSRHLCTLSGLNGDDLTSLYLDTIYGYISREEACHYYNIGNNQRRKLQGLPPSKQPAYSLSTAYFLTTPAKPCPCSIYSLTDRKPSIPLRFPSLFFKHDIGKIDGQNTINKSMPTTTNP